MIQVPPTKVLLKADDIREYEELQRVRAERQQQNSASNHNTFYLSGDNSYKRPPPQQQQEQQQTRSETRAQRIGLKK